MSPPLDRPRAIAIDRCLHYAGLAAGAGAVAALMLAARPLNGLPALSLLVYGIGLLAMLGCSALYNLSGAGRLKALFRRFDHAAIFFFIAATYTPFMASSLGGPWGAGMLAFVWAVAACGIVFKLFWPGRLENASVVAYLLLGWSGLVALDPLLSAVTPTTLALLGAGGLLYTAGAAFYNWRRLTFHVAIWHAFVLAAAACHYAAVLNQMILAGPAPHG